MGGDGLHVGVGEAARPQPGNDILEDVAVAVTAVPGEPVAGADVVAEDDAVSMGCQS